MRSIVFIKVYKKTICKWELQIVRSNKVFYFALTQWGTVICNVWELKVSKLSN